MKVKYVVLCLLFVFSGCGFETGEGLFLDKKKQAHTMNHDQVLKKIKLACSSGETQKAKELCTDIVTSNYHSPLDAPVGNCIFVTVIEATWNSVNCTCSYSSPETTVVGECGGGGAPQ